MKKYILLLAAISLCACINNTQTKQREQAENLAATSSAAMESTQLQTEVEVAQLGDEQIEESLNDIRFDGWEDSDWYNNDYFRAIRAHIDDFNAGRIEDSTLSEYKSKIQGKFTILTINPYLMGGVFAVMVFIDYPDMSFTTAVRSDVDIKSRIVSNYRVGSFRAEALDLGLTKEKILEIVAEHPENLLW